MDKRWNETLFRLKRVAVCPKFPASSAARIAYKRAGDKAGNPRGGRPAGLAAVGTSFCGDTRRSRKQLLRQYAACRGKLPRLIRYIGSR